MNDLEHILAQLKKSGNHANLAGMARFGIRFNEAYGCNVPFMRKLAKNYRGNHNLALELWKTGIHEARIIAFLIDDPELVTESQAESWLKDVKSWDICDGLCSNLVRKTVFAYKKAFEWSMRKEEFQKRAGFVMMAVLAVHDKVADDEIFLEFLNRIEEESYDDRNFVKKAVNWALRQIGKRNYPLHKEAVSTAKRILLQDSKSGRWIAKDALREFKTETTRKILERRKK
ncbi:MAG: DNA alkylation repair protein [Ignavibacteria bacterium]|nr:DNA alkylation repair protein [Ignavibacteria bacterium]